MNKKRIILIITFLLIFVITACNSKPKTTKPTQNNQTEANEPSISKSEETEDGSDSVFVPRVPVPKDLPVYPGATLWNDIGLDENAKEWMWLYSSEGSGNEIVEFFKTELEAMGFEIGTAHARHEEFGVADVDFIVSVGFLDDGISDCTEDSPGRGYMIAVNLTEWENR